MAAPSLVEINNHFCHIWCIGFWKNHLTWAKKPVPKAKTTNGISNQTCKQKPPCLL
jgi:hypothetical protein